MIVETRGLTKRYGSFAALDTCTLDVAEGEVFGLLGPNGAGKTTLLRLLLGYLQPTTGSANILGLDCCRDSVRVREGTAYLPGDARLFRQMRGRDVLKFFGEMRRGSNVQRANDLARQLELDLSRRVAYMSTGMRQKLALAATLSQDTPLIMLDEPTANLDPTVRSLIIDLVKQAKMQGRTVIFSSHVLSEVEEACDRVAILRTGKLVHLQEMSVLLKRHRIVASSDHPLPEPEGELADGLTTISRDAGTIVFETSRSLAPLLGWLSTFPLKDVRVEPAGIRAIYRQFHSEPSNRLEVTQSLPQTADVS